MNAIPSGLANLRDVAEAIPQLRSGALLRSDAPHSGDAAPDIAPWPPPVVVDLRDEAEKSERHPFLGRSRVVDLPLLGGRASVEAEASDRNGLLRAGLAGMYASMLEGEAAALLVRAIEEIAEADGAVLVHCTAGKDRTGVTVAVALALVGVAREDIVADYVRTGANMPRVLARARRTVAAWTVGAKLALDIPREIFAAPAPAMEGFLDRLDARGGAEAWFLGVGGSPETVAALQQRLRA
ncbi:tyrosine-protein phosphatase [Microbacterium oryzae]|uniref:Tyrosine-protein phosphatase n=1 Tax=Microbacterium oryzae TaxID=743009 RepID=A0A6I6DTA3_9MICO|nr:tyrosine-protein phosphatase [Microbacterium oryzae]QGU28232.1 tyrosine-protein phosphatase [Microbacterium oryzae]